jgi:hypothetical protein
VESARAPRARCATPPQSVLQWNVNEQRSSSSGGDPEKVCHGEALASTRGVVARHLRNWRINLCYWCTLRQKSYVVRADEKPLLRNPTRRFPRLATQIHSLPKRWGSASRKVTKTSLLSALRGGEDKCYEVKRTEQNSPGFVEVPSDKLINRHMVDGPAQDVYEIRPRKDGDGVDLISDRLRRCPIWYAGPDAVRNAVAYAKYRSRSRLHLPIIRVLDQSGAVIETHESRHRTCNWPAEV